MKKTNVAKRKLTTVYQDHPCIVPTCSFVGEFRNHRSHYNTNPSYVDGDSSKSSDDEDDLETGRPLPPSPCVVLTPPLPSDEDEETDGDGGGSLRGLRTGEATVPLSRETLGFISFLWSLSTPSSPAPPARAQH